jgi:Tol biopolymer transport system component
MSKKTAAILCLSLVGIGFALAQEGNDAEAPTAEPAPGRQLAILNLASNEIRSVGARDEHDAPVVSPDGSRIAVFRTDEPAESADPEAGFSEFLQRSLAPRVIHVVDVATGASTPIASGDASRLAGPAGDPYPPVWSPDSRELAVVIVSGNRNDIYRFPADGSTDSNGELVYSHVGESIALGDWSHDGRYLAFSASPYVVEGRLYLLDLESGGEPVVIAEADHPMLSPRFSPDGRYLSYLAWRESGVDHFVMRTAPRRGPRREVWQLTTSGNSEYDSSGFWDADDPMFYFIEEEQRVMGIRVDTSGEFEFGTARVVATLPETVEAITGRSTLSHDGDFLIADANDPDPDFGQVANRLRRSDRQQLTVLSREGREIAQIGEPATILWPSFSADGSRILAWQGEVQEPTGDVRADVLRGRAAALWIFDSTSGEATRLTEEVDYGGDRPSAVWMPGDAKVVYSVYKELPAFQSYTFIYRIDSEDRSQTELLFRSTGGAGLTLTDVSRDGRYLAFDSFGYAQVVPLAGDAPFPRDAIDLLREEFTIAGPQFSPKLDFVAFTYDENGPPELYLTPFDAVTGRADFSARHLVSSGGRVFGAAWRGDGRELYYARAKPVQPRTTDVPEDTDVPPELAEILARNREQNPEVYEVMAVSVSAEPELTIGEPRVLFETTAPLADVSPDGERFLVALPLGMDGQVFTNPEPTIELSSGELARYAGRYELLEQRQGAWIYPVVIDLVAAGEGLLLLTEEGVPPAPAIAPPFLPVSDTRFVSARRELLFELNDEGEAVEFTISLPFFDSRTLFKRSE